MATSMQPSQLAPPVVMLQMIQGFWVSRSIYVVAKLGIPDLLSDGPKTSEELAKVTGTHAPSLYRLLRALESVGVFAEDDQRRFAQTPLSATLRTNAPGSLRYFAIEELGENHYPAWEKVLYSVQTGAIAFNHVYGLSKWQYNAEHPEEAHIFDEAMSSVGSIINSSIVAAYDFSSSGRVVDVGGGNGSLLAMILKANPELRGVLLDLPHVVDGARRHLQAEGLAARCEIVAGDFFGSTPEDGDTYILKWIICDWDDDRSVTILKNCQRALAQDGKVLIIEPVIEPGKAAPYPKFMDLNMLVMTGGCERTADEYRALLNAANLRLQRITPTHTDMRVIEAVRS